MQSTKKLFTLVELLISLFIFAIFGIFVYLILDKYFSYYRLYEKQKLFATDFNKFINDVNILAVDWWEVYSGLNNILYLKKYDPIYSWYFYRSYICYQTWIYFTNIYTWESLIDLTNYISSYPNIPCYNMSYVTNTWWYWINLDIDILWNKKVFNLFFYKQNKN